MENRRDVPHGNQLAASTVFVTLMLSAVLLALAWFAFTPHASAGGPFTTCQWPNLCTHDAR